MRAYLEIEQVERLENAATPLRDRILIRLLARLGCRISEALALGVEDIDFTVGTVTIQHLKSGLKLTCPHCGARLGKAHTFCPRCGVRIERAVTKQQEYRRVRTLPLDKGTLQMLKDYIGQGEPINQGGGRILFGINRHRAWQIVKECAERSGLPKLVNPETGRLHNVSPHRLRDAFAVHAVKVDNSGDGLRLLQEQLGHVSFNTTAKYRKVAGDELRKWYAKLWDSKPKNK